jgi:formylglycine-generating enzyme required for sulfatase activity
MRNVFLILVFGVSLIVPGLARAQGPTPPPSILQVCLDEKLGTCVERLFQELGFGGAIFIIFIVAVLVPSIRKKMQEWVEDYIGRNPFARIIGVRRYLKAFIAENRVFGFRGMVDYALKPIDLRNAYIQLDLNFSKLADKETHNKDGDVVPDKAFMRQGEKNNFNLAQILQAGYKRVVIVGDAGSGKSALLQWAGMTIAEGSLLQKLSVEQKVFLKAIRINNLFRRLVPLLVPLRKYYSHCKDNKVPVNANSLHSFICEFSQREYRKEGLPDDLFRYFLRRGCLVMFDGMDEVESGDRPNVRAAIEGIVTQSGNSSKSIYLVTTRPSAEEVTSQLPDFETAIVLPITPQKRADIIELWCDAVYPTLTDADNKARDLLRRIENPLVNEMATTPLMINIFALVYYHSRDLPSQRAELFEQAVKALLTEPHKQGQAVSDAEYWGGRSANQRFDDLALIAYILHDEEMTSIFADDLISRELFWKRFGSESEKDVAMQKASDFLELVARRGGLLRQDGKSYDFYIRRFREFLAGHYVAQKMEEKWSLVLQKHIHTKGDQWIEPLLLSIGFLAYTNDNKAKKLMQALINVAKDRERRNYAYAIAGIALADILRNPTEQVRGLFGVEKEQLPELMAAILEKNPPALDVELRQRLGLALGEIDDPRLPVSYDKNFRFIIPEMVTIPAGMFRMGTDDSDEKIINEQSARSWDDEKPAHEVFISEYSIGKYPVTNAEFRCFLEQNGYDPEAPWWNEDGRRWRTGAWEPDFSWLPNEDLKKEWKEWLAQRPVKKRNRPFWWDDPRLNGENQPVVGISWFEMEAYCNWLSRITSTSFRLPTEAEWEHAARGENNLIWAWGNEWDPKRANTADTEKKIAGTSPVGMYPHGASPYGVQDMIGNVWEWCRDWYDENEYRNRRDGVQNPQGPATGSARVLRGGSWSANRSLARCSYRDGGVPDGFDGSLGFRLVCSPSSPSLGSESLHSESLNP